MRYEIELSISFKKTLWKQVPNRKIFGDDYYYA